jgi:hypothetical protein
MRHSMRVFAGAALSALALSLVFAGCGGEGKTPRGKNLLENASFEEVANGIPAGWEIRSFRGMETEIPAEWGVDEKVAHDGTKSFYFQATSDARRFFVLTQSIEIKGVERLRLRGAVRTLDIRRGGNQYPQSNFALTFYDKDGSRFESTRFYDFKTQAHTGSSREWILEDRVVRVPENTARVEFHCALGMEGKMWYDGVSLDVPPDAPWLTQESKNFTFHWLAAKPYPEGSTEFQQALFDNYCARLGIPEADRPKIDTYFYPDSATMFAMIGEKSPKKSYWDEREVHSIFPVDDHEIIHIITKPYGVLPFALTEGTAFYLMGDYRGRPVLQVAQQLQADGNLPELVGLVEQGAMVRINPEFVAPAAASFMGYLLEMYGPGKFLELHRAANAASSPPEFDKGFTEAYGFSAKQADEEWRALLRKLDFSKVPGAAGAAGLAPSDTAKAGGR